MKIIDGTVGSFPLNTSAAPLAEAAAEYRKTATSLAAPLGEDVTVRTPEGDMQAKAGDYLVQAPNGHAWPVAQEYFEQTQERV
jgi:hypothetical protein